MISLRGAQMIEPQQVIGAPGSLQDLAEPANFEAVVYGAQLPLEVRSARGMADILNQSPLKVPSIFDVGFVISYSGRLGALPWGHTLGHVVPSALSVPGRRIDARGRFGGIHGVAKSL